MTAFGSKKLLKDGSWVAIGQIGSIVGTVVGIRILTEYVSPEIYGFLILVLGIIALTQGTIVSPIMQAVFKFYPEYSDKNLGMLKETVVSIVAERIIIFIFIIVIIIPLIVYNLKINLSILFLGFILMIIESIRVLESTFLNAAQNHKIFALISISEAWGRPLAAIIFLTLTNVSVESILIGYVVNSSMVLIIFYAFNKSFIKFTNINNELKKKVLKYSKPLTPMAILGWMNGVGDRYLIGAMLGLEQAGLYAAVYGLMSKPFTMASSVVELTLRPLYNQLVAKNQHRDAYRLLIKWFLTVISLVGVGLFFISFFDQQIINILLAKQYHSGMSIMIWIAIGYGLLVLSDVFVKVCYAYGYTGRILMIQFVSAVLSFSFSFIGILIKGLLGAAIAVPAYFGTMLVITFIASKLCIRNKL